jgi:hypothetical protein
VNEELAVGAPVVFFIGMGFVILLKRYAIWEQRKWNLCYLKLKNSVSLTVGVAWE